MTLQLTYSIDAEQTTIEVTGTVPYAGLHGPFSAAQIRGRITTLEIDSERLQLQDVPLVGPWRVRRGVVGPAGPGPFPLGPGRYVMTTPAAHDAGAEVRFIARRIPG